MPLCLHAFFSNNGCRHHRYPHPQSSWSSSASVSASALASSPFIIKHVCSFFSHLHNAYVLLCSCSCSQIPFLSWVSMPWQVNRSFLGWCLLSLSLSLPLSLSLALRSLSVSLYLSLPLSSPSLSLSLSSLLSVSLSLSLCLSLPPSLRIYRFVRIQPGWTDNIPNLLATSR